MANDFDLNVNPLSGSQLEVLANDAGALDGTEKVLVSQSGTVVETTTQDIADLGGGSLGYSVYTALLNQSGTSAPTAIVQQNTIGITPDFYYNADGDFLMYFVGLPFDINKISCFYPSLYAGNYPNDGMLTVTLFSGGGGNDTQVGLYVTDLSGVGKNSELTYQPIEIRVYP